jgi:hypothetical protein
MATPSTPMQSRPVSRNKLAEVFKTPELLRAFEALTNDVAKGIPDAIQEAVELASAAAASADQAQDNAEAAQIAAQQAQAAADMALQVANEINAIPSLGDTLAQIEKLTARIAALEQHP